MKNQVYLPDRHPSCRTIFLFFFCCFLGSFLGIPHAQAQLQGNYTIGGSDADFGSFTDAIAALDSRGVSESVTFKVRPGTYREQLVLRTTYGPVTFEGESGDSTAVVLDYTSGHALQIEGASDFSFRHMTISGSEGAVRISGDAGSARSENLLFESNIISTAGSSAVIYLYGDGRGSGLTNLRFSSNYISGEGRGIVKERGMYRDPRSGAELTDNDLIIESNTIRTGTTTLSIAAQSDLTVSNNTITAEGGAGIQLSNNTYRQRINGNHLMINGAGATGIEVGGAAGGYLPAEIMNNRILIPNGGTGLHLGYALSSSTNPVMVANNMISIKGHDGSTGILMNSSGEGTYLYFNSIYLYGEDENSKILSMVDDVHDDVHLRNNIFANAAGGYVINGDEFYNFSEFIASSDYNNFYTSGAVLALWGTDEYAALADWQAFKDIDENSLSVNPQFESTESLIPSNPILDGAGIALETINTDFFGQVRNDPPDMGAVEFKGGPEEPVGPLAGNYTIGGESPDFVSFSEAADALTSRGISDAVTFRVRPGTYEEQLVLGDIAGNNCELPIVFEGESGLAEDVILQTTGYAVQVKGADGITFRHLAIHQINITEGSNCITLDNNRIFRTFNSVSGPGELANNHHIYRNNHVSTSIRKIKTGDFDPASPDFDEGLEISGNTITLHSGNGIELSAQEGFIINNNTITIEGERDGDDGISLLNSWYGKEIRGNTIEIRSFYGRGAGIRTVNGFPERVSENRINMEAAETIENPYGDDEVGLGGGTGIVVSTGKTESGEFLIANNDIFVDGYDRSGMLSALVGIHITETYAAEDIIKVYHNSIGTIGYMNVGPNAAFLAEAVADNSLHILNNIFSNRSHGSAIHIKMPSTVAVSDYNAFTGGSLIWDNQAVNLDAWQELSGMDIHSITSGDVAGAGIKVEEVDIDIEGKLRNDPPSIGAIEHDETTDRDPLQGTYTIGGEDGNYATFSEAVEALTSNGISGSVTFMVRPGTYEEQLVINDNMESSCDQRVIFEGSGTSRAEVVLQSPEGSDFTIRVNGADGVEFRHMAIVRTVEVNAGTDCFSLEENIISGSVLASSSANARNNQHRYRNNLFQTGSIVIENEAPWDPEAPVFDEGLIIEGNEVSAISINGQRGFNILDNQVSVSGQEGNGIEITNSWYGHAISGNTVSANIDNYQGIGMVLRSAAAAIITENSISTRDGGFAFLFNTGKSLDNEILVANNLITSDGYDARGIFYKPISNLVGLDITNNYNNAVKIYHNTIQVVGYSEYVSNYALSVSGTGNSFHILNNAIVNYAYGWAVIAEPSAIAEMDYNNIVTDGDDFIRWGGQATSSLTEWQNLTGFDEHSIAAGLGHPHEDYVGAGIYVEEVPRDYYGQERNDPPTIGAVETAPTRTPLNGIYTIGGEEPDFSTFAEAIAALGNSGIEDSVVFRIRPGEYTEQLNLGSFGLDARITFEGESGDSTDVILRYPLDDAIVLNGTSNFSLRHITVMSGIQTSGGRNMLLESNVIHGGVSASMHSGAIYRHNLFLEQGISKSGEGVVEQQGRYFFNTDVGVVIEENTFRVAGSAIYLTAQEDIVITGNHITIEGDEPTTVRPAVRVYSNLDIQELSNNTIVSHVSNTTGLSLGGIYFASDLPRDISNNRIELLNGGTGISVSSGGSSPSVVMKNNMIAINANNPSTGISLSDTPGQIYLYHNSVLVYGADSSSRAMYFGDGIDREVHLQNNLFANQTGGPVFAGEDFEDSGNKISSSDYNNLYTSGEVLAHWENGAVATLNEWQVLTGFDENSLAVDPQFESAENLTPANPALAGAGIALEAVTTDFFGNLRNDPPAIGAVEIEEEEPREPVAVTPIVECVVRNADGSFTASFGYNNPNQQAVQLSVGSENFLDLMEYAGQPESFAPGRHERAFHVVFDASESLSWTLGDTTVTADRNATTCPSPVQPVEPIVECVSEIDRSLSLATMGYHNPNDAPVAIATGRLNRMLGQQDQGQPTVFEPGMHQEVFALSYSGALMWTLGSQRARITGDTPECSPALQAVQPLLDCVSDNGDGTYTAHFGYHNPNEIAVSAGSRLHNLLLPAFTGGDELPVTFEPGRHERVFSVPFRGQRLEWRLMGNTARATRSAALACGNAANARTASLTDDPMVEGSNLEVYPNPFSKTLQLKLPDTHNESISIKVFALSSGMLLMEDNRTIHQQGIQLDLEQLGAGAYILEIKSGETIERIRIMKH